MQEKKEKIERIIKVLESASYADAIEILANVFIHLGAEGFSDEELSSEVQLFDAVLEHQRTHGESLPSALVLQGLHLLAWLDSK